jgi:Bacterial DNA-binding protein
MSMPLTQSQMIAAVADRAEMSKADAKRALDALDEIVLQELGNAPEGSARRAGPADGARQARHQEAHWT